MLWAYILPEYGGMNGAREQPSGLQGEREVCMKLVGQISMCSSIYGHTHAVVCSGGQRTSYRNWFTPPTMWSLEIELRSTKFFSKCLHPLNHLASPKCLFTSGTDRENQKQNTGATGGCHIPRMASLLSMLISNLAGT